MPVGDAVGSRDAVPDHVTSPMVTTSPSSEPDRIHHLAVGPGVTGTVHGDATSHCTWLEVGPAESGVSPDRLQFALDPNYYTVSWDPLVISYNGDPIVEEGDFVSSSWNFAQAEEPAVRGCPSPAANDSNFIPVLYPWPQTFNSPTLSP